MLNWYSGQESIVKPEKFAPRNLDFVKFGVIVFIRRVYNWMKAAAPDIILEKEESVVGAKRFFATESGLAVFHSYFGAPAAVALAEALIAAEIKQLIVFGEAGSISPKIDIGEILIPTFAIREEGVSYHHCIISQYSIYSFRYLNQFQKTKLKPRLLEPPDWFELFRKRK